MRALLAAVVAASIAAALPTATADAAKRKPCTTARGATVAASAQARVYRVGESDDATYYGCWLATRRRTTLGSKIEVADNSADLLELSLAGRYAGFDAFGTTDGIEATEVPTLVDLRSGRTVAKGQAVVSDEDAGRAVTALVPTTAGRLLWAGRAADCVGLHVAGAAGQSTLSCGATTELALSGARAYWLQDGQPRTAVLP